MALHWRFNWWFRWRFIVVCLVVNSPCAYGLIMQPWFDNNCFWYIKWLDMHDYRPAVLILQKTTFVIHRVNSMCILWFHLCMVIRVVQNHIICNSDVITARSRAIYNENFRILTYTNLYAQNHTRKLNAVRTLGWG